jgi:Cu2+-exporting ATPase
MHVWYDAAVMFVLLLLVARMFEQRARGIASAQVDALARARPALAVRERADGSVEQVPLGEIAIGDVLRVAAGESVPADGTLLDHAAAFDEALITGESTPVRRDPGGVALAGSICREQSARMRVTRTGADTRLSQLTRLVEQAQSARPRLALAAERVAGGFVVALLLCAMGTFAWWHVHEPARALEVTLALLVVSCPCALSLAIPTALTSAHGALARMGVLGLSEDALSTLARVDRVMLDKTGTLSTGRPELDRVATFDGMDTQRALAIAAALEHGSAHPLAQAFARIENVTAARNVVANPGHGIEGEVDGVRWRLGRAEFAVAREDDGALWLGDGARALARITVRETMRDDARDAVVALRQAGLAVELCSGDAESAVARFARQVGIGAYLARQSPEQKLARVRAVQARGEVVAMVGDGLNDAPVLAGADVSLAMAEGAALAQRAADLVITSPSLLRVPQAIVLARRTQRIVHQNLAWALGYNVLAIPLAATGYVTPWIAAVGMAASSLLVTLNALRLGRREREAGRAA